MKQRKLKQERVDRINRQRELREGERSLERDYERLVIVDGRVFCLIDCGPGMPTLRGRE